MNPAMNTTFKPSDFIKLLFETLSYVGLEEKLDMTHDNPPRDLRITVLRKAAAAWELTAPLSQIANAKIWEDPEWATRRVEALKTEFPPEPFREEIRMHDYVDALKTSTETLIKYRRKLASPKGFLAEFLYGGGLMQIMDMLHEKTKRIQPELDEIDELLAKFLLPGAQEISTELLPELREIKGADIENF